MIMQFFWILLLLLKQLLILLNFVFPSFFVSNDPIQVIYNKKYIVFNIANKNDYEEVSITTMNTLLSTIKFYFYDDSKI